MELSAILRSLREMREYEWSRLSLLRAGHYSAAEVDKQRARYDAAANAETYCSVYADHFAREA